MEAIGAGGNVETVRFRFLVLLTFLAILFATMIDLLCAWIMPIFWYWPFLYVLYTTCVSVILLLCFLQKRELRRIILASSFFVSMVVLYEIQWNTRKPFLMDLNRVHIGMTSEDVERVMNKYIRGSGIGPVGRFGSDENGQLMLDDSLIFRHSNDGAFNADWGVVRFKDGRVTKVEFLPD